MFKSVIKEILIMLLLCVAIVLILGVIFYNYIPTNKAIPNKLAAYTTPENVKTEIEEEVEAADRLLLCRKGFVHFRHCRHPG